MDSVVEMVRVCPELSARAVSEKLQVSPARARDLLRMAVAANRIRLVQPGRMGRANLYEVVEWAKMDHQRYDDPRYET